MLTEYSHVLDMLEKSPYVQTKTEEQASDLNNNRSDIPELEEEAFDRLAAEFEETVYTFDAGKMLAIVADMQEYRYHQALLKKELAPVKKKIEMSDYMSALDALSKIQEKLRNKEEGGTAGS